MSGASGPGHLAAILTVVTREPRPPAYYKRLLASIPGLGQRFTVEVVDAWVRLPASDARTRAVARSAEVPRRRGLEMSVRDADPGLCASARRRGRGENDEIVFAALSKADRPLTAYDLLGRGRAPKASRPRPPCTARSVA